MAEKIVVKSLRGAKRRSNLIEMLTGNCWGSTLDDFLKEEGIRDIAKVEASMCVIVWQLAEEMRKQGITKTQMAEQMKTSHAQVDRMLKAKGNVTIETLQRTAALVSRELRLELV